MTNENDEINFELIVVKKRNEIKLTETCGERHLYAKRRLIFYMNRQSSSKHLLR